MAPSPSVALRLLFAPTLGAVIAWAGTAAGYCRQTTCDRPDCPKDASGCISTGEPLFYSVPCLSFAIDAGSAEPLGISDEELELIVMQAFRNWQSVDCPGGGHPSFDIQSVGAVEAGGIYFCEEETLNVSVWTLDEAWMYEQSSLGYTTSTFVVDTGEVFDADVELNMRRIASLVPTDGDVRDALLSVATHEAGHFLGLAHSDDGNAVMAASYQNLRLRTLTSDDIEGICALYPPDRHSLACSEPGYTEAGFDDDACRMALGDGPEPEGTCSVTVPGDRSAHEPWWLLGLATLVAARRRGRTE